MSRMESGNDVDIDDGSEEVLKKKLKPRRSAFDSALKLVARREYSRDKLTKKLIEKQYEPAEIDEAVEDLIDRKFLDDDRYARLLARKYLRSGYGIKGVCYQLQRQNIKLSPLEVQELMEEMDLTEEMQIEKFIKKKNLPKDLKEKRRLFQYLVGRGFPYDLIQSMLA
jgi:regulatory protein